MKEGDPAAASEAKALRSELKPIQEKSDKLESLAGAYSVVTQKLRKNSPELQEEIAKIRVLIQTSAGGGPERVAALGRCYAALNARIGASEPGTPDVLALLINEIRKKVGSKDSTGLSDLAVLVKQLSYALSDAELAGTLALFRQAMELPDYEPYPESLIEAYLTLVSRLSQGGPRALVERPAVEKVIEESPRTVYVFSRAFAALASKAGGHSPVAGVLARIRGTIADTLTIQLVGSDDVFGVDRKIANAYSEVAALLPEGDALVPEELKSLRNAMLGTPDHSSGSGSKCN
jgi:hypothetical protein